MPQKPYVLAIAGTSGAGKTTIVKLLAESLDDSAILMFDDYEDEDTYPKDFAAFAATGFDINELKSEKFATDIATVREGHAITDPKGNSIGEAAKILILEEPTGRSRDIMKPLIDYVVCLDLPYAISYARRMMRIISENTDSEACLQQIRGFTQYYIAIGYDLYVTLGDKVLAESDLAVNALKSPENIVQDIIDNLKEQQII